MKYTIQTEEMIIAGAGKRDVAIFLAQSLYKDWFRETETIYVYKDGELVYKSEKRFQFVKSVQIKDGE